MEDQAKRDKFLIQIAHADGVITHLHTHGQNESRYQGWVKHYTAKVQEAQDQGFTFHQFPVDRWVEV